MKTNSKIASALLIAGLFLSTSLVAQRNPLHLEARGHTFSILGGEAGEACAILVGLEHMTTDLPGGSRLEIAALAVLAQGKFDESGEFTVMIGYDGKMVAGYAFHLQAISYEERSGNFYTSNLLTLDFTAGSASMIAPQKRPAGDVADVIDGEVSNDGLGMMAPRKGADGDVDGDQDSGAARDRDDGRVDTKPIDDGADTKPTDDDVYGPDGRVPSLRGIDGDVSTLSSASSAKKADTAGLEDGTVGTHN